MQAHEARRRANANANADAGGGAGADGIAWPAARAALVLAAVLAMVVAGSRWAQSDDEAPLIPPHGDHEGDPGYVDPRGPADDRATSRAPVTPPLADVTPNETTCSLGAPPRETRGLRVLDLSGCGLRSFSARDVPDPRALDVLFLTDNALEAVPDLTPLSRLSRLSLKGNRIGGELDCAALPPRLVHVILTDNRIERVPASCAPKLARLRKLMLARNRVRSFEGEFPELELVRLSQNALERVPAALLSSASAPRLKWASFGANACCPLPAPGSRVPRVPAAEACRRTESQLRASRPAEADPDEGPDARLGSGTSGVAVRCGAGFTLKRFTGRSSDGDSAYEVAVTERVPAAHPNLVAPVALAVEGATVVGVVMPRVQAAPVALPPDIVAVSRDIFPAARRARFPPLRVLNATLGAASAVRALHAAGVAHGDVYLHNFLMTEGSAGAPRDALIDMGAATLMDGLTAQERAALQELDCRAFAVLADEMVRVVARRPASAEERRALERAKDVSPCREA